MSLFRRKLLLLLGAALAAVMAGSRAFAGTYSAFPITNTKGSTSAWLSSKPNATTSISMADRAAYVANVREFGAVGDGVTDDKAAIQAAVNWTSAANRGIIFFPPGTYLVSGAITFSLNAGLSIIFQGVGGLSTITGNFAGYILDRTIMGGNDTSGGRVIESLNIVNTHAAGGGIRLGSTVGGAIRDCTVNAFIGIRITDFTAYSSQSIVIEQCAVTWSNATSGSNGIIVGGNCVVSCCDIRGFETAIRAYGVGVCIQGCRIEVNGTGILCGLDESGANFSLSGFGIHDSSFESNLIAVDLNQGCGQFLISGLKIQGFTGAAPSGGNPQYGIRINGTSASYGLLTGISVGGQYTVAGVSIGNAASQVYLTLIGVNSSNSGGGSAWAMPTNAQTAKFINCDNPAAEFTFANLPSAPVEGDEYSISDCNTATFLATAAAGGSGATARRKVRYNETSAVWQVVG